MVVLNTRIEATHHQLPPTLPATDWALCTLPDAMGDAEADLTRRPDSDQWSATYDGPDQQQAGEAL